MNTTLRIQSAVSLVAASVAAVTFALSAQAPETSPASAPRGGGGQRGRVAAPPAEPGAQAPARGGRNGQGGPGKDDPINADVDYSKKPSVLPKSPAEELKQFTLQPGYRLQLVLADPEISNPAAIAFDGNGRMFVLEQRGYMNDADATGELDPVGRISLHTDTNNDGVYDKHTVFVDHLIFPRFVTPFGPNTVLTKESNSDEVWKFTDTNGDGVADKKELFDTGYGRTGNVEHQEAFLTWSMDNWMYSTYNAFRARWTPHGILKETTGANGSAWGVTQDNDGKQWFQGGASGLPSYWQFPIVYGNFGGGRGAASMDPDLAIPWGAPVRIADMQGGMAVIRMPDGSLKSTTAGAGGDIFRGDRLPKDLIGDYLYGEQVARIVRRVRAENQEGMTVIRNAYNGNEFIKSMDPYFRPVSQRTAPDGTLYIADMYHGIIQESQWTPRGSYLRAKIEQYDIDKVIHLGRIWRLVYDGVNRDKTDVLDRDKTVPHMNTETAAQLVTHLSHPNGWWRDTAQQLLVLKQDKSVVPALQSLAKTSPNLLARFHAIWTLEGLGAADAVTVRQLMEDREPRMRVQAIRVSETLYKAGDKSFAADYKRLASDSSVDVSIQSLLTMNRWKVPEAETVLKATAAAKPAKGVQLVASGIMNPAANARGGGAAGAALTAEQQNVLQRGGQIYSELCFSCHGADGYGTPRPESNSTMGPPLAGSPRVNGHRDYVINAVLRGLTGPVGDKTYTEVMVPMDQNKDEWVAAVASFVRNSFGNSGGLVTVADVARVRAATTARKAPWTIDELQSALPRPLPIEAATWKFTASSNTSGAANAMNLNGWNSQGGQTPGMWFQIELPQAVSIVELQFESRASGGRGGGAGRGAAGAAAGPPPPPPPVGYPRGYKVETSANGTAWTEVATGEGQGGETSIALRPSQAKLIKITQTGTASDAPPWSIANLRVLTK